MKIDRTEDPATGDTVYRIVITKSDAVLARPNSREVDEITRLSSAGLLSHLVASIAIYMFVVERERNKGDVAQRKSGS